MSLVYDLHSHSTASDGVLTPSQVVLRAVENKVDVLALTDHDTISGLAEAKAQADLLGIKFINGVEISTNWESRSIHIVGLNFNERDPRIITLLASQAEKRRQRAVQIGEKLAKNGIINAFAETQKLANGEVTRVHYARYLIQIGKVANEKQAFKKYLSQGKSAYVKTQWIDIPTAIEAIHLSGGVAVLAHPLRYNLSAKWIKKLMLDFKQWGGDGVEVAGCGQTKDQRQSLANWANEYQLRASADRIFIFLVVGLS